MIIRLVALVLAVAGCSENSFGPIDRLDLARAAHHAQALWAARRPASYSFEVRVSCFCVPDADVWTEVRVVGASAVGATRFDPPLGESHPSTLQYLPTIDRLFELVRSSLDAEHTAEITAEFDPQLGYPRFIGVTCRAGYLDCGSAYAARNVKPLP